MAMALAFETLFPRCPAGFFSSGDEDNESLSAQPTGGHCGEKERALARPSASSPGGAVGSGRVACGFMLRVVRGTPHPDSMERWSRRSERLASWLLGEWQREQAGASAKAPSSSAALGLGAGPPGRVLP